MSQDNKADLVNTAGPVDSIMNLHQIALVTGVRFESQGQLAVFLNHRNSNMIKTGNQWIESSKVSGQLTKEMSFALTYDSVSHVSGIDHVEFPIDFKSYLAAQQTRMQAVLTKSQHARETMYYRRDNE